MLYEKLSQELESLQLMSERQFANLHNGVSLLEEWQAKTVTQPT